MHVGKISVSPVLHIAHDLAMWTDIAEWFNHFYSSFLSNSDSGYLTKSWKSWLHSEAKKSVGEE